MESIEEIPIITNNSSIKGYISFGIILLVMGAIFSIVITSFISFITLSRPFETLFILLILSPFIAVDFFLIFMGLLLLFGKREVFFREKETISMFKLFGVGVGGTHYDAIQPFNFYSEKLDINMPPSSSIIKESSPLTPINKSLKEVFKILKNLKDARDSYENHENAKEVLLGMFIFLLNNGYVIVKKSIVSNYFFTYKIKSRSDKTEFLLFRTDKKLDSYLENSLESKMLDFLTKNFYENNPDIYPLFKDVIKHFFENKSNSAPEAFICNLVRVINYEKGFFFKNEKNLYIINETYKTEILETNKKLLMLADDFSSNYSDIYQTIKKQIAETLEAIKPSD